jgi:pyruvate, water dikinase
MSNFWLRHLCFLVVPRGSRFRLGRVRARGGPGLAVDSLGLGAALVFALVGCGRDGGSGRQWSCQLASGDDPAFVHEIGCDADFDVLASEPPSASIPGARSVKTVVDRLDGDALYFQNSQRYQVHYEFASAHLSGNGRPIVPPAAQFNQTEYYAPDRRFILGAVTYYAGPKRWVYEMAPYDAATADLIAHAYRQIAGSAFFGDQLYFHPTSEALAVEAENLPDDVPVLTTEELFAGIDYQPLNLGTTMGRLVFVEAAALESQYLSYRDIAALDRIPNDISIVMGIITDELQTPLSHINVLSQNRGTPNMALRGAFTNQALRELDGKWVELTVGPFAYEIREVGQQAADQWWEEHRPEPLGVPELNLSVTELRDADRVLDIDGLGLAEALAAAIPAFGGKASHYAALPHIEGIPEPKAFAVPVYFYRQFMEQNQFDARIAGLLLDPEFRADPAVRDRELGALRDAIIAAPVDAAFMDLLLAKLSADFPGVRMRFRSSTNAEDLAGFTGAGLYSSKSGDPGDPARPVVDAVREVWASVWNFRAFEEREFRGIDHQAVGMALLVHRSFQDEEVNGVALTANIFDRLCLEPGHYINAQKGEASVVKPEPGVTTDQFIYHFDYPGQPVVWISHSSLVGTGETVMSRRQTFALGEALKKIHDYFAPLYGPRPGEGPCDRFYGMDVEFKFDGAPGEEPALVIKQARPHPGWGL